MLRVKSLVICAYYGYNTFFDTLESKTLRSETIALSIDILPNRSERYEDDND